MTCEMNATILSLSHFPSTALQRAAPSCSTHTSSCPENAGRPFDMPVILGSQAIPISICLDRGFVWTAKFSENQKILSYEEPLGGSFQRLTLQSGN